MLESEVRTNATNVLQSSEIGRGRGNGEVLCFMSGRFE